MNITQKELNRQMLNFAEKGEIDAMWESLESGADINAHDGEYFKTALILLSEFGHLTCGLLKKLVQCGARIDEQDSRWNTALMLSAREGHLTPELLNAFVQHGADINIKNGAGWTALMNAIRGDNISIELLNGFIQNGADLNVRDMSGETVLMFLSRKRIFNSDFLEVLVRNEADSSFINAQDRYGRTALMMLAYFGNLTPELLESFVSHGADVNMQDWGGNTGLMYSVQTGFKKPLLDAFLKNGAERFLTNGGYTTRISLNSLLVALSCGYSIRDMYKGWTPENFLKRVERDEKVSNSEFASYILLAAMALLPEKSGVFEQVVCGRHAGSGFNNILGVFLDTPSDIWLPIAGNLLRLLTENRKKPMKVLPQNASVMVRILLHCMDTEPVVAIRFLEQRIGKQIEQWVEDGVEGADILVSRLVPHVKDREKVKKNSFESFVDF